MFQKIAALILTISLPLLAVEGSGFKLNFTEARCYSDDCQDMAPVCPEGARGHRGKRGARGPRGPRGPRGATGPASFQPGATGATGANSISVIPYASGTPIGVSVLAGGATNTGAVIAFGSSMSGITFLPNGNIVTANVAGQQVGDFAFKMPYDGFITSITADFTATAPNALNSLGVTTLTAELYIATEPNIDTFVPSGAFVTLNPAGSPIIIGPIAVGDQFTGTATGLAVPVPQGARVLLVYRASEVGGDPILPFTILGVASAGVTITPQ